MKVASLPQYLWQMLGFVLTTLCLWLALRGADLSEVLAALGNSDWRLILVAFFLDGVIYVATAIRWRWLFRPHHDPRLRFLLAGLLLAQLANTVFPAKLGPVVRAVYVGIVGRINKAFVLATVVGEKVWEGVTLILAFALMAPVAPVPSWLDRPILLLGAASFGFLLGGWVLAGQQTVVRRCLDRLSQTLPALAMPTLQHGLYAVLDSLAAWRLSGLTLWLAVWSMIIWTVIAALNYTLLAAMRIRVPAVAALLLLVILQAGARLPSSPGNVGVFHYLAIVSLELFGVAHSVALSYAIVLHAFTFVIPSLAGALILIRTPGLGRALMRSGLLDLTRTL